MHNFLNVDNLFELSFGKFLIYWAVVVAQLVERSPPIPEVRGSNPVILFILNIHSVSTVLKRRK